jgi:hypothetical protein
MGSQPGWCSALPCCLAHFVITCGTPGRRSRQGKSALQPAKEPPHPPSRSALTKGCSKVPGVAYWLALSVGFSWESQFVVTVCCSRRIAAMTLTCMQACIRITRVCTSFMSKAVIVLCLCQGRIAKVMQACNFYCVACPGLKPARG